jgi:tetratricopeptide (TPR) repeat protein
MPSMRKEHAPKVSRKKEDIDFEIAFYESILKATPDFIEALSAIGDLYTKAGLWQKGLDVDLKLSRLRPEDAIVFYNLACSYALLNQTRAALVALTQAIDFGYDDFEHLKTDTDLENLLKDERFQQYIKQLEKKKKPVK